MPSIETIPDTPVMRQYQALKDENPETILFFRLGDFYEMFAADAQDAAPLLGLVLTSRQGIPMCGVPAHSATHYISKLLKAGRKVAVAEQLEEPSKTKKLVRRGVTRIITPGTVVEDELLDPTATNYLVAVVADIVGWGLATVDVSTGEFWATQALNDGEQRKLKGVLARIDPSEVLASAAAIDSLRLREFLAPRACLTPREEAAATPAPWCSEPVWFNHHLARKAAEEILRYVAEARFFVMDEVPRGKSLATPAFLTPVYRESASEMLLDETAIRTLELVESPSGEKRHTLWGLLDACRTSMGSRLLRSWILHPSTELQEIELRQNCVEELHAAPDSRLSLAGLLSETCDFPRVINRLATQRAGPRDLASLRHSLAQLPRLQTWLSQTQFCSELSRLAAGLMKTSGELSDCLARLDKALDPNPPARLSEGRVIRDGYHSELDELRALKTDSQGFLTRLENSEREATQIPTLKAGYNQVFGYYFEVTRTHQAKVPARYTRKQTLTNAERYVTPELKELENKILGAEDKIARLEARLFDQLRQETLKDHGLILRFGALLAELDVFNALATSASLHELVKPKVDLSHDLIVVEGRHPVLEALLASGTFVPNSIELNASDRRILVLTGPNMSGKSTYLRQSALIAVMAQIGSFVPAQSAKIGIVDKILTRIGAQDRISEGASTFMVEMRETSHILAAATARSLIVLDEVGRGTSTFDGISIAWAVLEHLHSAYASPHDSAALGPRVLFATHYFELTDIAGLLPGVVNGNVEAREWTGADGQTSVVFLHRISPGPADRSYGIHVAALAGLPASCLARANEILNKLENESASGRLAAPVSAANTEPTLPLFEEHPVLHALKLLDCDKLTPLEALTALSSLKKKLYAAD